MLDALDADEVAKSVYISVHTRKKTKPTKWENIDPDTKEVLYNATKIFCDAIEAAGLKIVR